MVGNSRLNQSKKDKYDEFYTQFFDIQKEVNHYLDFNRDVFRDKVIFLPCDDPEWSNFTKFFSQNFETFGLKKLISTSYSYESKNLGLPYQPSLFETENPNYDIKKDKVRGKLFILEKDTNQNGKIDVEDLEWTYLEGDGDFRSDEVKRLRDESDIIITNPPFSLFREFLSWIFEGKKDFIIIGNQNVITYKEVFPLLKDNKIWLGGTGIGDMEFKVPSNFEPRKTRYRQDETGQKWCSHGNVTWITNIDHGKRHEELKLMTWNDNIKYNKKMKGEPYRHYDNYKGIEVPYTELIPSDYEGVMGVPITFMDKYNPDQFEILGVTESEGKGFSNGLWIPESGISQPVVNGEKRYKRIFIRKRK